VVYDAVSLIQGKDPKGRDEKIQPMTTKKLLKIFISGGWGGLWVVIGVSGVHKPDRGVWVFGGKEKRFCS